MTQCATYNVRITVINRISADLAIIVANDKTQVNVQLCLDVTRENWT